MRRARHSLLLFATTTQLVLRLIFKTASSGWTSDLEGSSNAECATLVRELRSNTHTVFVLLSPMCTAPADAGQCTCSRTMGGDLPASAHDDDVFYLLKQK
jgi:hypothetical protein